MYARTIRIFLYCFFTVHRESSGPIVIVLHFHEYKHNFFYKHDNALFIAFFVFMYLIMQLYLSALPKMFAFVQRILDWIKSLFWKEEMELTLVGLQYSGKTTFVNVIAVSLRYV